MSRFRIALERIAEGDPSPIKTAEEALLAGDTFVRRETSPKMSKLAARLLKRPSLATADEIKSLAASVLAQDETK